MAFVKSSYTLIYITFVDISLDNGKSINEREFVQALLASQHVNALYIGPKMKRQIDFISRKIIARKTINRTIRSQISYQMWLLRILHRLFKKYNGKIMICARPHYFTLVPIYFSCLFRVPYVVKYAGLTIPMLLKMNTVPFSARMLGVVIHFLNALIADRIWVVTERVGEYWHKKIKINKSKIFVIPNGVNTNNFNLCPKKKLSDNVISQLPKAKHYIGYIGALRLSGVEFMIEAAEVLIAKKYNYAFVIAGTGEDYDKLVATTVAKNLNERFVFLGQIPYEDLADLNIRCDVLMAVFPKEYIEKWGSSSQKIFQYLACGRPVIAAKADDHMFIESNRLGRLVESENICSVSNAIVRTIKEVNLEGNDAKKARYDFVMKNFSYKRIVTNLVEHLDILWTQKNH